MAPQVPPSLPPAPTPPLQVDTVTGFWDILGALGDFFGGIFAGGALLIAAIAYKRQVEDAIRRQAASVVVRMVQQDRNARPTVLMVENGSDRPIYLRDYGLLSPPGKRFREWDRASKEVTIHARGTAPIEYSETRCESEPGVHVVFHDTRGNRWHRGVDGSLARVRRGSRLRA